MCSLFLLLGGGRKKGGRLLRLCHLFHFSRERSAERRMKRRFFEEHHLCRAEEEGRKKKPNESARRLSLAVYQLPEKERSGPGCPSVAREKGPRKRKAPFIQYSIVGRKRRGLSIRQSAIFTLIIHPEEDKAEKEALPERGFLPCT